MNPHKSIRGEETDLMGKKKISALLRLGCLSPGGWEEDCGIH